MTKYFSLSISTMAVLIFQCVATGMVLQRWLSILL